MTTRNLKNTSMMIAAIAILMVSAIGCSQSSNPMGDDKGEVTPPPVEIKAPKALIITSIKVTGFNSKNSDKDWDWDPFSAAKRRPDIYVQLQRTGYLPIYTSDSRTDAYHNKSYTFTKPASIYDGHLPREIPYTQLWKVFLVDDDFGGNQTIGSISFRPSSLYNNDNASSTAKTVKGSNGVKIVINGTWKY